MIPLKSFDEYIERGIAKKTTPDPNRSKSLEKESQKRMAFLNSLIKSMGITEGNSNYIVENSYDSVMEFVRSKMYGAGLTSSGEGAHEAEVAYTKKLGLSESEMRFLNEMRYRRNGILYYGKDCSAEYAKEVYDFIKLLYERFKSKLSL